MALDGTIMNIINDPNKGRASRRSNYSDQHPLAERQKCATTRVSVEDKNSQLERKETKHDENKRPKRSRSHATGAGTPPKVDSTAGLDAPVLTGPA